MVHLSASRSALVRSLHRRKGRREQGAFLAEGERLLSELAGSTVAPHFLFATAERLDWVSERFPDAAIFSISTKDLSLFATDQAQGLGAVVPIPEPPTLEDLIPLGLPLLMLDRISDPGNLGTIVRTAEWFGLGGVLVGEGSVDLYNPKSVRATMGAIFRIPIIDAIDNVTLFESGLPIIALDHRAQETLGHAKLPHHAIYVVGNEAHGVSPEILGHARTIAIKGGGGVESLNAAVAAAVLCYELAGRW